MYSFENLPAMPLTIEGASLLHQMFRVRWPAWRALAAADRAEIVTDATAALTAGADRMRAAVGGFVRRVAEVG